MPVTLPRRSSTSGSGSLYGSTTSTRTDTSTFGSSGYGSSSSYLDRASSLTKTYGSSLSGSSIGIGIGSSSKYGPSYSSFLSTHSSYTPRTSAYRSSSASSGSSYLTGGASALGTYRSTSTYTSNNDSTTANRYGLNKTKSKLSDRKDKKDDNKNESKKPPSGSGAGTSSSGNDKRLSGSYSSSSLARLVATSGVDLYEKYSPAHYKPNCELSRSRSAVTEAAIVDAEDEKTNNSISHSSSTIQVTLERPRSRYSRLYDNDDNATESANSVKPSHRSSGKLTHSSSASGGLSNSSSISDVPTYTLRGNRLIKTKGSTDELDTCGRKNGHSEKRLTVEGGNSESISGISGISGSGSNSNISVIVNGVDPALKVNNYLKDLKLSPSSSATTLHVDKEENDIEKSNDIEVRTAAASDDNGDVSAIAILKLPDTKAVSPKLSKSNKPGSANVNANVNVNANANNTTVKSSTTTAATTTKTRTTVAQAAAGTGATITSTSNKHHNSINNSRKSIGANSINVGTAGVRKINEQHPPTKTHVKDIQAKLNSLSRASPANAVRAANQQFFLISAFKDQNFLKAECELAHAQVAVPAAQQQQQQQQQQQTVNVVKSSNNSNTKRDKVTSASIDNNCNSNHNNNNSRINNNNNNNNSTNINSNNNSSRNSVGISNSHQLPRLSALPLSSSSHGMRRFGNGSIYTGTTATSNIISTTPNNSTTVTTATTTSTNNSNGNNNNNNNTSANNSSKSTAATAGTGTTSTTVQRVDIVFNQFKALPKTTKSTSNYTGTQPAHSSQTAPTSASASLYTSASVSASASVAAPAPSIAGGTHTIARLSGRQLVKPLVHRTIPTTAVAAANAAAAATTSAAATVAISTANSKSNSNSNPKQISYVNSLNNNNNNNTNNNTNNNSHNGKINSISSNNNSSSNNNNNNNTSNMHQQYPCRRNEFYDHEHDDDIKYIDSDEVATTSAPTTALERKTVTHVEQPRCNLHSGAPTRSTRVRPKSTIICSGSSAGANQLVFEKVNNYRYANGGDTAHVTRRQDMPAMTSTTTRQTGGGIDSHSIKASIEKFNSYSEQKRLPLSSVTLRSHAGSGSANNLQHHRHSGSDFEHCHLHSGNPSGSSGGSLTRTPYRSGISSIPTASGVSGATGAGVTSAKVVTTSIHASPAVASAYSGSVSRLASMSGSSSASSTNSLPTATKSGIGAYNSRYHEGVLSRSAERASASSLLATAGKESGQKSSTPGPVKVVAQHQDAIGGGVTVADAKKHVVAAEGGACATTTDSIRSTTARSSVLPPSSPSSSRYWDRENSRTSSLTSSAYNSTNNSDDIGKSTNDEKPEGLCGLRNIGNTCFMNSIIQCLSHTSELTKFLRTHNGTKSSTSKDQQILLEFAKLIREMWTSTVTTVTPMELKRAFSSKHRMYSDYNQQDAQEFLRFFLDSLHCALNTGVKGEHLKIDDNLSDNRKADLTWEWYTRHENSLIRDLFVGQLKSTLKCTTCGNTSVTFDPFWDLSVPLPSSNRCKLDACLDFFIREEILDGDEMPTCSKCKTRRKCTKSFTIQRFPKYLVIHLKRFSEARWSKMSNIVEFPTGERELNMGPYGSNHNMNIYYSLYAISNHMGSTAGGHYVALCKHPVSKKWHEFNDNIVSDALSENHLVSSSAYILFYERA